MATDKQLYDVTLIQFWFLKLNLLNAFEDNTTNYDKVLQSA